MQVTWLGHSCFRIESREGTVILDPYRDGSVPGLSNLRESADLVLCSHGHDDHCGTECVTITGEGKVGLKITAIPSFHDSHKGMQRGKNTIHLIEGEGYRIAHLGDLGCDLTADQKKELLNLDLLMIPVGGFFTIDARQAAALVGELKPKTVIPMHFHSTEKGFGYDVIGTVGAFTELMESVVTLDASSISLEEPPKAQVVVLTPANLKA